ncbi:DUF2029 domain-containing protein [Sphingomonas sediminicola]|uniref:DUF2029 domain-containing protein n=1 Tax=Sphingomonas sediminicola TaxID=386874 RepID=A0ABX6T8T7_9SPHN|nr:glycosyltransferase family 87 protein [Sphingomonas sediminicola]QNP46195.1 DUF2029 domain-containing protein [Sphingomonas sediminicola]
MRSRYSIRLLYEAVVVVALASASLWVLYLLNSFQPLGADFAPVWTAAAHLSSAYDIAAITQAQPDFTNLGQRPFAYPPTALLLFAALGLLPFWLSYATFTLAGLWVFVWAALRAGAAWWVVVFPPLLLLAHIGQPSLLVGGLILSGLVFPACRGVVFGIAVALKPQLCLFLPLVFLFERDLRGATIAAGVAAALAILATLSFGSDAWTQWIAAARDLVSVATSNPKLSHYMINSDPLLFAVPAFALVWVMRNSEPAFLFAALIGAALLVSPYAMNYETALLIPAFVSRARPSLWIFAVLLVLVCFVSPLPVLVLALLALVLTQARDVAGRTAAPEACAESVVS